MECVSNDLVKEILKLRGGEITNYQKQEALDNNNITFEVK